MALNASLLEQKMLQSIRYSMKGINTEALPTEFQENLARALAKGVITLLKKPAKGVGSIGTASTGTRVKKIEVKDDLMTQVAFSKFKGHFPQATGFIQIFFESIMVSVKEHLEETEIFSVSGFGGPVLNIVGFDPAGSVLANLVFLEIPANFIRGQAGVPLIKSLSAGISTGILSGIIKTPLPQTNVFPPYGPLGPTQAKFI